MTRSLSHYEEAQHVQFVNFLKFRTFFEKVQNNAITRKTFNGRSIGGDRSINEAGEDFNYAEMTGKYFVRTLLTKVCEHEIR